MRKQVIESERYFCLSVVIALITNLLAFQGSRLLEKGRIHHDLTTPLDPMIPFLPWTVAPQKKEAGQTSGFFITF